MRARHNVSRTMSLFAVAFVVACRASTGGGAADTRPLPDGAAVVLTRGACLGGCPVYAVTLFEDGRVTFDGRANVARPGRHEGRVATDSVQALVRTLRAHADWTRDGAWVEGTDACGRYLPDGPRFTLVVAADGPRRTLEYDAGCVNAPRTLSSLADAVDRAAAILPWISGPKEL